jgi:hypothetical protein
VFADCKRDCTFWVAFSSFFLLVDSYWFIIALGEALFDFGGDCLETSESGCWIRYFLDCLLRLFLCLPGSPITYFTTLGTSVMFPKVATCWTAACLLRVSGELCKRAPPPTIKFGGDDSLCRRWVLYCDLTSPPSYCYKPLLLILPCCLSLLLLIPECGDCPLRFIKLLALNIKFCNLPIKAWWLWGSPSLVCRVCTFVGSRFRLKIVLIFLVIIGLKVGYYWSCFFPTIVLERRASETPIEETPLALSGLNGKVGISRFSRGGGW